MSDTLHIAEIPFESGNIRFRYSRVLAPDGRKWIREGWFTEFFENRVIASEGEYRNDVEVGQWREYYPSGILAAEGEYREGKEHGVWRFWNEKGQREADIVYSNGEEQSKFTRT